MGSICVFRVSYCYVSTYIMFPHLKMKYPESDVKTIESRSHTYVVDYTTKNDMILIWQNGMKL